MYVRTCYNTYMDNLEKHSYKINKTYSLSIATQERIKEMALFHKVSQSDIVQSAINKAFAKYQLANKDDLIPSYGLDVPQEGN